MLNVGMLQRRYRSWLRTFPKHADVIELHRMRRLLELMGHPERDLKRKIQIIGTNGKGSTTTFMQSILSAAGYRVGVFSSPAFVTESEQIRLGTEFLADDEFEEQLFLFKPYVDQVQKEMGQQLTRFEVTTALAVLLFRHWNVDIALFEAGLGGAYDSTSILRCPLIAFTNVSIDHTRIFGHTVHDIASDKIQAVRGGTKAVATTVGPEPYSLLQDRCATFGVTITSPRHIETQDISYEGTMCQIHTPMHTYDNLHLSLVGLHQSYNASLALTTLEEASRLFDLSVSEKDIREGCSRAVFPGRFHVLSPHQFRDPLPEPPHIVMDGAHNRAGIQTLIKTLDRLGSTSSVAVFATKNWYLDAFKRLVEHSNHVYLPRIDFAPFFKRPEHLVKFIPSSMQHKLTITDSLDEALFLAAKQGEDECHDMLISGSLYYLGAVYAAQPGLMPPEYKESPLPEIKSIPAPTISSVVA